MAVNATVFPTVTDVLPGVTEIDCKVGPLLVTESEAVPLIPDEEAVIVTLPVATPVARPGFICPEVSIVASDVFDDVHDAEEVRSFVEPSL